MITNLLAHHTWHLTILLLSCRQKKWNTHNHQPPYDNMKQEQNPILIGHHFEIKLGRKKIQFTTMRIVCRYNESGTAQNPISENVLRKRLIKMGYRLATPFESLTFINRCRYMGGLGHNPGETFLLSPSCLVDVRDGKGKIRGYLCINSSSGWYHLKISSCEYWEAGCITTNEYSGDIVCIKL